AGLASGDGHVARPFHVDLPMQIELRPAQVYEAGRMNDALNALAGSRDRSRVAHIAHRFLDRQPVQAARVAGGPHQHPHVLAGIQKLAHDVIPTRPVAPVTRYFITLPTPLSAARWFRLSSTIPHKRINRRTMTPLLRMMPQL